MTASGAVGPAVGAGGEAPAWLRWVRLAARVRVSEVRTVWRERPGGMHGEMDALVADAPLSAGGCRDAEALDAARDAALADPAFGRLARECGLGPRECEWLALLAALHIDPRWERLLGYLADDPRPGAATPALATLFWRWPPGTQPGPASPVVRWQLAAPADVRPWAATTSWTIDPDVAGYLCGTADWWRFWGGLDLLGDTATDCLFPALRDEMLAAARSLADRPIEIELTGPSGSGRRVLLAQLCRRLGRRTLLITDPGLGVRALRTARLLDAVPLETVGPETVRLTLDPVTGVAVPRDPSGWPATMLRWTLPGIDRGARLRLWSQHTDRPAPPSVRDWAMTPAEVLAASAAAPAGPDAVTAVVRRRLGDLSSALLTSVRCPYGWSDLVVPDGVLEQLSSIESQVRMSDEVLDEWGFARLTPGSRGITALLAGPSGTGKTMATQVLARSLDLDLYRVDLSEVVNKYIGETEKRLAQVFDECERCNIMLLFDEADALFGQRTRVRDAHDRFANIEIDYLLQRMESFAGVAVLATNRKGDLDPAFMRRIRIVVDFPAPSATERHRLWEAALPELGAHGGPVSEDVDLSWFAAELELTGAEIKAVTLTAAFLARSEGRLITTGHLLAAARRELAKRGAVLRAVPAVTR
ncbi:ATP-binding protein [Streptomyces sp. NPDC059985]|uniref:ATP-binding protein n=1 Tax=Streptomyces sp. NPDC059985 TaxID=3347025 RepID=UPI003679EEE0